MPIVRNVVRTGVQVAGAVRDLARLREIAQVLGAHGFGFLLDNVEVPGLRILRRAEPDVEALPLPERATAALQELGPTFVKLGQVLSTRPDLLPVAWCKAFERLQDDVKGISYAEISDQIQNALGAPPSELFATVDETPLASASIAQVHRATLPTGEEVALKVQRPGIRRVIETDIDILGFLVRQVERQVPELGSLQLGRALADFEKSIRDELDFRREADNAERFARNLADLDNIHVPVVYRSYSASEVLCLEFIKGTKIREARAAGFDMPRVGQLYLRVASRMLFEDAYFHGDLHPGNVLVMEGPTLGLLDFGMVGFLTHEMRDHVVGVLIGIARADFRSVARVMFEVGIKTERVDYIQFEGEVMELMQRHLSGRSMGEIQIGGFLTDLLQGCLRHNITVPSGYTMLFKGIITSEGLAKDLIPELDPIVEFTPVLESIMADRFSPERLSQDATLYLLSADHLLRRLPIIAAQMISDYESDRLRLQVLSTTDEATQRRADMRSNRGILAGVGAALVLTAALILGGGGLTRPTAFLAWLLMLSGLASLCWLLLAVWRAGGLVSRD